MSFMAFHSFCTQSYFHSAFHLFIELSSMKFATFAFVVANVASVSVSSDDKAKALSLLEDVSRRAEERALLARGQPHQSFMQNDLEALSSDISDSYRCSTVCFIAFHSFCTQSYFHSAFLLFCSSNSQA